MKEMNTLDVVNRLNVLIALEFEKVKERGKMSNAESIQLLHMNGFVDYKEIAALLHLSPKTVANQLTSLRPKKRGPGEK